MNKARNAILGVVLLAAAGSALYENRQVARLTTEKQVIKEQVLIEQVQPLAQKVELLQKERDTLKSKVTDLQKQVGAPLAATERTELLRLRGEVGPLRQAAQELRQYKQQQARLSPSSNFAPQPSLSGTDLDIDKVAMARAQQLWQKLGQTPGNTIPEMQLLKDEDWRRIGRDQKWDTEEEAKKSFSALREAAKSRLMDQMAPALQAYAKANGGQYVSSISDLAAYLPDIPAGVLDRYEIVAQKEISNVKLSTNPEDLVIREKQVVDAAAGENQYYMNVLGNARATSNQKGAFVQVNGKGIPVVMPITK